MEINLTWCQSSDNIIGKCVDGTHLMPWYHIEEDMKHFYKKTVGNGKNGILMGYKTWLSLKETILPKRENFVLTVSHYNELNVLFDSKGNPNLCHPVKTIDEAIRISEFLELEELWIIGGGSVYNEFLTNSKYLNQIHKIYQTVLKREAIDYSNLKSNPICYSIYAPNIPLNFEKIKSTEYSECIINEYLNKNYKPNNMFDE